MTKLYTCNSPLVIVIQCSINIYSYFVVNVVLAILTQFRINIYNRLMLMSCLFLSVGNDELQLLTQPRLEESLNYLHYLPCILWWLWRLEGWALPMLSMSMRKIAATMSSQSYYDYWV